MGMNGIIEEYGGAIVGIITVNCMFKVFAMILERVM